MTHFEPQCRSQLKVFTFLEKIQCWKQWNTKKMWALNWFPAKRWKCTYDFLALNRRSVCSVQNYLTNFHDSIMPLNTRSKISINYRLQAWSALIDSLWLGVWFSLEISRHIFQAHKTLTLFWHLNAKCKWAYGNVIKTLHRLRLLWTFQALNVNN